MLLGDEIKPKEFGLMKVLILCISILLSVVAFVGRNWIDDVTATLKTSKEHEERMNSELSALKVKENDLNDHILRELSQIEDRISTIDDKLSEALERQHGHSR